MNIEKDDQKLVDDLGQALYANPQLAHARALESVAAVSTLANLNQAKSLEAVARMLLMRSEKEAKLSGAGGIAHPFFRLEPRERFVLSLLKSGRFSYAKIGSMLSQSVEEVERIAWEARMRLGSSPEIRAPHPVGAGKTRASCPEYDLDHPWTQRLLDDEMKSQELVFTQNHAAGCETCRRSLTQAREFYYAVEALIPESRPGGSDLYEQVRRARMRSGYYDSDLTWSESIVLFFSRREIQAGLVASVLLIWVMVHLNSYFSR